MTHATEPTVTEPAPAPAPAVGEVLRQARADLGLSVDAVAQKLHLAPRQIQAIESEDYEHLPGPTYVRGYLRSYALLLGLKPEAVVAQFNRRPSAARPVDLAKHAPAPQLSSQHRLIKITTLIVAALVLGLAAIWWQGREDSPVRARRPHAAAVEERLAGDAAPAEAETAVSAPAPGRAPRDAAAPEAEPPSPAPAAETAATAVAARPLVLHFQQDSWADVRDGQGDKLLYATVSAGRVIRLGGAPPFSIFLGNADGVRIEYQGRPFDASRFRHGSVARFTLGATERAGP